MKTFEKLFHGYGDSDATLTETEMAIVTNDDGMIDPVELKQLIAKTDAEESAVPLNDEISGDSESDAQKDGRQSGLDDFSSLSNSIWHPGMLPVITGVTVGRWIPDRLSRELKAMTPESDNTWRPTHDRVAKGTAAYALYVCLVSLNLALLGALPA